MITSVHLAPSQDSDNTVGDSSFAGVKVAKCLVMNDAKQLNTLRGSPRTRGAACA